MTTVEFQQVLGRNSGRNRGIRGASTNMYLLKNQMLIPLRSPENPAEAGSKLTEGLVVASGYCSLDWGGEAIGRRSLRSR